jgi:Na+/melibiose symporter-like transporter
MIRKLGLIGALVVGALILAAQADAASAPGSTPVQSTSTTAAQMPVANMFIAVPAPSFTLIPVASTFIPVTQHGGRGRSHRVVKRFSPSAC